MAKRKISIEYQSYAQVDELSSGDRELIKASIEASEKAYAPYSAFPVGAALRNVNGEIYTANNQENASYPAGTCAERSLLNFYHANFPSLPIQSMAISAPLTNNTSPVTPCGFCRQVLSEMESIQNGSISLFLHHPSGMVWHFDSVQDLLPLAFDDRSLPS